MRYEGLAWFVNLAITFICALIHDWAQQAVVVLKIFSKPNKHLLNEVCQ
jgi:hypothetical protein